MEILGVKIDNVTYQQALEKARGFIEIGGKHYIVTPNPEIIVKAQKDKEFKEILNKADMSVPDGIGLVFAAALLGKSLPERVTGVDLLEGLVALAEEHGYSLFLLGGREGVAEGASKKLKIKNEKLKIVGAQEGPRLDNDGRPKDNSETAGDKRVIEKINQAVPDVLVVGFGAPKQEKWIARNLPHLSVKLAIGVGGALSYISGEKRRAPGWAQRLGFEWAFRLVKEPSRFRRQLAIPYFGYLVLKERFKS